MPCAHALCTLCTLASLRARCSAATADGMPKMENVVFFSGRSKCRTRVCTATPTHQHTYLRARSDRSKSQNAPSQYINLHVVSILCSSMLRRKPKPSVPMRVCVFPAPVCPYARTHALNPLMTVSSAGTRLRNTSSWTDSGPKTRSKAHSIDLVGLWASRTQRPVWFSLTSTTWVGVQAREQF